MVKVFFEDKNEQLAYVFHGALADLSNAIQLIEADSNGKTEEIIRDVIEPIHVMGVIYFLQTVFKKN